MVPEVVATATDAQADRTSKERVMAARPVPGTGREGSHQRVFFAMVAPLDYGCYVVYHGGLVIARGGRGCSTFGVGGNFVDHGLITSARVVVKEGNGTTRFVFHTFLGGTNGKDTRNGGKVMFVFFEL